MKKKGIVLKVVTAVPNILRKEIYKNRKSTPFLISISFLISFILSRLWVILLEADKSGTTTGNVTYSAGKNLILGGYHIHHIAYGIILVAIAAWLAINYWSNSVARISSILYGIGLGFIVDEIGFVIGGVKPYSSDREVFFIAVFIVGSFLSVVYFPSFYRAIKRDILRWKRFIFQ
ncbi:MAG: hypothetical protein ACOC40_01655 [Thermoplasmatota archaeon]